MDPYSRMVNLLKVLLPLAALALLSTVFLISRGENTEAVIPFAQPDIEERLRGQQVTGPYFSGTTTAGDEISVTATVARAGADVPLLATDLQAEIRMVAGGQLTLRSDRGTVHPDQNLARFIGNVEITSADGLRIRTDALKTNLSTLQGESPSAIEAEGVLGKLTAGRMEISAVSEGGPVTLLFTNGVKLVYDPQKLED